MALIKCPECEREITNTIKTCPHCGYKIKRIPVTKIVITFTTILLILAVIAIIQVLLPWMEVNKYNKGVQLLIDQNYEDAITYFEDFTNKYKIEGTDKFPDIQPLVTYANARITYESIAEKPQKFTKTITFLNEIPKTYNGELSEEISDFRKNVSSEFDTFIKLRKEQEELEKSKKSQEAFYSSVENCPLKITSSTLSFNAIEHPQVSISVKNNSSKTIDHYVYNTNVFEGIYQGQIHSGGSLSGYNYYWTPYGHENTRKFFAVITSIHYTDNTTWKMPSDAIEYAQTYADDNIKNQVFK